MPKQSSTQTQNRLHKQTHQRNTVRYYVILLLLLSFLFFSGNFGSIDVQKTAIVMAVGIDREEDTFIVTSQIAVPQPSKQGNASQSVQIVSRGKTIADAFKEINAKTGWYPKLVFCRLLLLGQKTAEKDVFDALDFFLLDEYMSDNCLIATCDKTAKELLNVTALVDSSGALAMEKVLSLLEPNDVYYANALAAIAGHRAVENKEKEMYNMHALGNVYRFVGSKCHLWGQPGYGDGNAIDGYWQSYVFSNFAWCDELLFDNAMKPGDVYTGSDGVSTVTFEANYDTVITPCGVFENCERWVLNNIYDHNGKQICKCTVWFKKRRWLCESGHWRPLGA